VTAASFPDGARSFAVEGTGRVAYVAAASDRPSGPIWISERAGSEAQIGDAGMAAESVAFTPEPGTLIIGRTAIDGASRGIWLVHLDGRAATQLTSDGSRPRWLP
jgi:hypothetical protein